MTTAAAGSPPGESRCSICARSTRCSGRNLARLNNAFDNATRAIETDERTNTIVFASTAAAGDVFPATYGALAGRLGPLDPYHPVGLDLTAQKLLQSLPAGARGPGPSTGRQRRRAPR